MIVSLPGPVVGQTARAGLSIPETWPPLNPRLGAATLPEPGVLLGYNLNLIGPRVDNVAETVSKSTSKTCPTQSPPLWHPKKGHPPPTRTSVPISYTTRRTQVVTDSILSNGPSSYLLPTRPTLLKCTVVSIIFTNVFLVTNLDVSKAFPLLCLVPIVLLPSWAAIH